MKVGLKKMESNNKGLRLIIIALLLLLIATLVVGILYIKSKGTGEEKPKAEIVYDLEEFLLNLKPEGGRNGYLKVKISVMYTDDDKKEFLESNVAKIRDAITSVLMSKTSKEMGDVKELEQVKKQMKDSINAALREDIVEGIYISDIVIQ